MMWGQKGATSHRSTSNILDRDCSPQYPELRVRFYSPFDGSILKKQVVPLGSTPTEAMLDLGFKPSGIGHSLKRIRKSV